ncbi:hypothetical protein PoB_004622300 [Plakobranchus ocellatus]|uniref:Uncharacterized protein n=1 Tax=Plakobranchus ocellatus TaxID=259542 RepID=A0AAV4BJF6_9GAST|nr:hypothetical protein PoB_004622300 [Plakobranchus ocellatus]
MVWLLCIASSQSQQVDLRLSGIPSGQGNAVKVRTSDRFLTDFRKSYQEILISVEPTFLSGREPENRLSCLWMQLASPQQGDLRLQGLCQARAPVAGLEPATERSLHISGRIRYPLCY